MSRALPEGVDVEAWNDRLAREHDIDDYYERSNPIIRYIEQRRLDTIRELVAPRRGERLLEIGCGGGHVLRRFPECRLVGVDVSGEMLAKAKKNLAGFDVELHKGDAGAVGRRLADGARRLGHGVQGLGLLLGIVLDRPAAEVQRALFGRRILTGTSTDPRVLRLLPPLTFSADEADLLLTALAEVA